MDNQESYSNTIEKYFLTKERGTIFASVIDEVEVCLIEKALERCYGSQAKAAKILGINRNTLHSKIKKYHIDFRRFRL